MAGLLPEWLAERGGSGALAWLLAFFLAVALLLLLLLRAQHGLRAALRQGFQGKQEGREAPCPAAPGALALEGEPPEGGCSWLLAWLLALRSWRLRWQAAWLHALNARALARRQQQQQQDPWLFTFEEDAATHPLELVIQEVISVVKSAEEKVISCNVVGNAFHFIVSVSHTSPVTTECQSYNVKLSPLYLKLELSMKSKEEDIQVKWSFIHTSETNIEAKPTKVHEDQEVGEHSLSETLKGVLKNIINEASPSVILNVKSADAKTIQSIQNAGALPQGTSPPKPPRAHELKLLVKNIRAILTDQSTAGTSKPICIIQLNDPLQKFSSSVPSDSMDMYWKDEFIFELNAKSKDLQVKILKNGEVDSGFSALATVPLDLFRKQPSGRRSFALNSQLSGSSSTVGSVFAEFSYIEPSETRFLQSSAKLPVTKVEKDRTVMPCGTVVTTVTAVKAKPLIEGRPSVLHSDSPIQSPIKVKVIEKDLSVQAIHCRSTSVSKALSSSDTELLVLNGTDPVAEVAIRQLSESAKQKLKSPRKKSTIIISGVSKTNLSQDSEAALMLDYAATMDGSYKQAVTSSAEGSPVQSLSGEKLSLSASQTIPTYEEPQENSHDDWTLDDSSQQWQSNALLDQDCDKMSGSSVSVSESGTMKKSKGGILKKSAKLFFLRRHHQKDPGMSQSHNDLIYLQQPASDGTRKKGGTLTRILNKKIIFKSKSKSKLNGTSVEPHAVEP
ncbi:C2 domain-containing protein 2 isoform X2 [Sceloporus undulatus]|uniref:C2 domain-containing protein 2 isoform X2 n=1 Tax=Sceloporus undulatus TaxID=8520 RepID=UPI001C4BED08|nr:C2 domain-containing protein 2 isoform X2 [Sceloporus undulatus]